MAKQIKNSTYQKKDNHKVNDKINYYGNVRLVYTDKHDTDSSFSKIITMSEARKLAEENGMDLMEINSNVNPPVIRMLNYSKYLYEQKKADRQRGKNSSVNNVKEVQLSTNISMHDLETKVNNARKFIEKGSKVRVVLTMRGRELLRREESKYCIYKFINMMEDVSLPESMPKDENNRCVVILKKK